MTIIILPNAILVRGAKCSLSVTELICYVSGGDPAISERTVAQTTPPLSRSASLPPRMLLQIVFEPTAQMSRGSDGPQTQGKPWRKCEESAPSLMVTHGEIVRGRQ